MPNMSRAAGAVTYTPVPTARRGLFAPLSRIRYQLLGGLLVAVIAPALLRGQFDLRPVMGSIENALIGTAVAMLVGAYALRRLLPLPGVQATSYILPTFLATYGMTAAAFLLLRVDYSRFQLLASFLLAVPWFAFVAVIEKRYKRPLFAVLPHCSTKSLTDLPFADWIVLKFADTVPEGVSGVVADLRADVQPEWERLLAAAALKGVPVYHSKYVRESLTGRVEIEHLSENSLGSLLPSSVYLKVKRGCDTIVALLAAPFLLLVGLIAAILIKLEDGGPVFFNQERMGHGGRTFTMFKFRTMVVDASNGNHFTERDDPRITRIGKILRRYRIDELPQVLNILRGEMSWIGPRPESLPLAASYEAHIPFYAYRHIVRPGITGWAQVQQGWAAELGEVTGKLHFDFFYIKYFSPWMDLLITARTIRTVLTGFGAR